METYHFDYFIEIMSLVGLEQNPKLGYYKVAEHVFYSKPEAYIHATQTGIDPVWNFNNIEFAGFDWAQEPATDLRELYRLRALQLREKYDYIRLECSGGGDSATAAFAFLLNGIHLDEVVFRYPKQGEKGVTDDPLDFTPENTLSEWRYAAKPLLDWIKTNFPKTAVRIHDYSEDMISQQDTRDESWVFNTRDWFQPGHADKYSHFALQEHKEIADSGQSICVLIGIDKPKVVLIDNNWYTYFIDVQANSANPIINEYTNITSEYFYWTPDFPEIVAKQSHLVKAWFDMPQNQNIRHLVQFPNSGTNQRTTYESIVKSIIYPDYDLQTWQTSKPTNSFYNEMDHWFYTNFQDTRLYQTWQAGLELLMKKIDPKYFEYRQTEPVGLQRNLSPFYYLGTSKADSILPKFSNRGYLQAKTLPITVIQNKKLKKILV